MTKEKRKAVILSGGLATRLFPLTEFGISKQALPIYNKPVIYYPLGTLQSMGITDVLIITGSEEQKSMFEDMLGDGSKFRMNFEYTIQDKPRGLADAFIVGEEFIDGDPVTMILGDNIFIGETIEYPEWNTIYTYKVENPQAYGVATVQDGKLVDIVEKPEIPPSDNAVVGLYHFNGNVSEVAKNLKPSPRGELEITDLIAEIHKNYKFDLVELSDTMWFDVGSFDSLLDCANLVRTIETRSTQKLGLKTYEPLD